MFCLTKVDQHQQGCQQHVQGLILGVYQFPGIIEASWYRRRLILISKYMFLNMLS